MMLYMLIILMLVRYRHEIVDLVPKKKTELDKMLDYDSSIRKDD